LTTRERIRRTLAGELPDRIAVCEISIWPETLERWKSEGLPNYADPIAWLGMDLLAVSWFDCSLRLPSEVIEDCGEYYIDRDGDGVVWKRWRSHTATPTHLDTLIKTPDDWYAHRHRLAPSPDRIPADYAERVRAREEQGFYLAITPVEPMWWVLMALGFELGLTFIADYPDVVEDMVAHQARLSLALVDMAIEIGKPDALWYFSDLCYRNGMLFSPKIFREILLPHLKRVTEACHDRGLQTIFHCDGYVGEFIPLIIEAGFDAIQPLEARAGNDVRVYKPLYGDRITLFGNISVERLSGTLEEAEQEVATKVSVAAAGGRYIFHSDHSVPPSVPLENFRLAVETAKRVGSYQ